jgi:cytochrome P450
VARSAGLSYDPYDTDIYADPYPVFRRLREEAPLYYNEQYDFFAVSRFDDVEGGLVDRDTFISSHGDVLEAIKNDIVGPPGFFIFEDPPRHTMHRGLLSRVFTPMRVRELEPQIRRFCADALDPLVGADQIDFVGDLGAQMPVRTIGMLLGVPETDQQSARQEADDRLRNEPGRPRDYAATMPTGESFAEYLEWRARHPSGDLMTDLLQAEFEDETGTVRALTRAEILVFVNLLFSAGNETTNRLIGWTGKLLSDHPDQRRALVADRSLATNAIEEVLRYEPPALQTARYVAHDVRYYGQSVPAGSAMLFLLAAANRDDRRFPDGDTFDVRRRIDHHLTFSYGAHFCLGAALARLEGRIALEEVLARFPDWEVDAARAELRPSTVRGWETLPAFVGRSGTRSPE